MCCYSKIIPNFRSDDVTPVSMYPPNTELHKYLDGGHRKIQKAVQFQNNIPSVIYLVNSNHKLYCFISDNFNINTTGIYYNVCTCICCTEAGNDSSKVNDLACYCHRYTMTNPCVPHSKYMRDHDTYDDIRGGK